VSYDCHFFALFFFIASRHHNNNNSINNCRFKIFRPRCVRVITLFICFYFYFWNAVFLHIKLKQNYALKSSNYILNTTIKKYWTDSNIQHQKKKEAKQTNKKKHHKDIQFVWFSSSIAIQASHCFWTHTGAKINNKKQPHNRAEETTRTDESKKDHVQRIKHFKFNIYINFGWLLRLLIISLWTNKTKL
jgi:hypothetical protein